MAVVALGQAVAKVGVAVHTTAMGVVEVAEAAEARLSQAVDQDTAMAEEQEKNNRRSGGRGSGGKHGGRSDGVGGHFYDNGTSSSFTSPTESSTEKVEVTVVARKRQVTPSSLEVKSSAERLSEMNATEDSVKPVPCGFARVRTSSDLPPISPLRHTMVPPSAARTS